MKVVIIRLFHIRVKLLKVVSRHTIHHQVTGVIILHDSLKVTTASDFDLSSNQEFSIEFWVYISEL